MYIIHEMFDVGLVNIGVNIDVFVYAYVCFCFDIHNLKAVLRIGVCRLVLFGPTFGRARFRKVPSG